MKKILMVLVVMALLLPTLAQAVPNVMSYQGKLNDKNGVPVSGPVTMTFTIYDAATGGNALWTETWTGASSVNVSNGIFNVALGSQTPFSSTLFSSDTLYLGIKVGTDAEMSPRQQITSGSYVFKAKTAEYTVPIGTIMAWAKSLTGVPALPSDWVECNGQTLNDAESLLNGKVIPDLNAQNRFLRGSHSSGSIGGSETHAHILTAAWMHSAVDSGSSAERSTFTNNTPTEYSSTLPSYYEVVWIMKVK